MIGAGHNQDIQYDQQQQLSASLTHHQLRETKPDELTMVELRRD